MPRRRLVRSRLSDAARDLRPADREARPAGPTPPTHASCRGGRDSAEIVGAVTREGVIAACVMGCEDHLRWYASAASIARSATLRRRAQDDAADLRFEQFADA